MSKVFYDPDAPRKPTNLTINTDLLRQARERGLNLSRLLEERLVEVLQEKQRAEWLAESQAAIEEYNERVKRAGVFSDGLRRF
ncbi:MAG: type II toxin-antitoxin system CcdA family antitoxin [Hyphomicrobium sp.]